MAIHEHFVKTHLHDLWNSMEYADLLIQTGDRIFRVHRAIVSQCAFFAGACREGFLEAKSGTIEMHHDPSWAVRAFLQYLYTIDYDGDIASDLPPIHVHAHMYAIADKYNVPPLKSLAARKFDHLVGEGWLDDVDFKLDFFEAVQFIYANTLDSDKVLRGISVAAAQKHVAELFQSDRAGEAVVSEGKALLAACPEFAIDLALAKVVQKPEREQFVVDLSKRSRRTTLDEYLEWTRSTPAPQTQAQLNGALYDSDDEQEFM